VVVRSLASLRREFRTYEGVGVKLIDAKIDDQIVDLPGIMGNAPARDA
jgi:hypothetical protein